MADHDHAAGPRGEEEASRGPDPESAPSPPSGPPSEPPSGPPQNGPVFGPPPPPRETFATFVRQRHAQIIGAGLIGLLIGGLLGGGAVAILFRVADHGDRHRVSHWEGPGRYGMQPPADCWYTPDGGTACAPPYRYRYPRQAPVQPMPPVPTMSLPPRTGLPTPVPSPTG
ncbi:MULTISPECIES: hypothetical protein [Nonomuraea]|uniref:Uncharacterized protein n=1 Tax=Nonomuraea mangrovi TaxID=2316207 RepID=A0ABW4T647_9ACTN